ncbi:filamentous hemagglutinin family protein [Burkholderia contaminans]|uniref:filamentous haemagglutinin family protein n=1 Tax=Burkholderia contaminans TaxID=488447 RepID=UPI002417F2DB|nr:filamentous haemagglutinin family protein [Burkholderia contaminans]WFN11792.1 filamentous hemagglutinin family protein [Burkholderia contaminans]
MAARARTERQLRATASRSVLKSELSPLYRAVVLMLAAGVSAHAHAAGIMNLGHVAASPAGGGAGGAGGVPGMPNLGVSPQQALQASQPSIRNLGNAAHAIAAQIAAQQNAAAAAKLPSTVPNGLAPGGLQVAAGASGDTNNPVLWVNANAPTQNVDASGHVNVDVKQTGQNAVLTWETMNVGRQTTLNFDQSGGTQTNGANNWAVLNRINDPSGRPSQILGNITAQGAVYVINRNGVLFGAGSQVNVHSLVASSLNLLDMKNQVVPTPDGIVASNQQFLSLPAGTTGGLAYPESGSSSGVAGSSNRPNEILGLGNVAKTSGGYQAPGDITIEQGASIVTHTNGTVSDGGFVLVAAPNVTNGGSITATDGQVVLAAGVGVSLRPNSGLKNNPQLLLPELSGQIVTTQNGTTVDLTPVGTLTNTGIVQASRGSVNLLGGRVAQNGVVGVTTSVNTPGRITISTADEYTSNDPLGNAYPGTTLVTGGVDADNAKRSGLLTFGPGSVTTVLPDNSGQTATSTPGTTFTPGGIAMTAGAVWFQGGSLIEAPGSNVSVTALSPSVTAYTPDVKQSSAPGRIYQDAGSTIDVSGLANVEIPIAQTLVTVDRIGQNELADSPLLRDSFLAGLKNVVVDSTLTGTRSDGVSWVGSPILNLSGYVNLIPRSVDQLLTNGGTITLSGNEVMTARGSSLNLNGGYVHVDGGIVNTTRLADANGAIVPIGQASQYETYVGIAGQFIESHPRWGVTKTWYNPLLTGGSYQGDYIVGGNAGTLDLFATSALVLDGDISAQSFGGAKQMQGNSLPAGGTFNLGADSKLTSGTLAGLTWNNSNAAPTGVTGLTILQGQAPQLDDLAPGFSSNTPIDKTSLQNVAATDPHNVLTTMVVPVDVLNAGGFSNVNVTQDTHGGKGIVVAQDTRLNVQPGGSIALNSATGGTDVNVAGSLSAPGGSISITSGGNIVVGPQAVLSAAGQWVNNDVQAAPGTTPGNTQFVNGGNISLATSEQSIGHVGESFTDATGAILLRPGSVLDVSSGGELLSSGQLLMQNGVPVGRGGNVSLQTYVAPQSKQFGHIGDGGPNLPTMQPANGTIALGGTILSDGFSGGGTLTLQALGFRIGGDQKAAAPWDIYLPESFFAQQGFGKYVLNAYYDTTVAPGATVTLTQRNLIPDALALQQATTGTNLSTAGLTTSGRLDDYHRQPTSLVLTGGNYVSWLTAGNTAPSYPGVTGAVTLSSGASIHADAGASVGFGSPTQVTVLGSIVAPGGSITLSADSGGTFGQTGQYGIFTPSDSRSVWLGADAALDVSGTAIANPLAAPVRIGATTVVPNTGKVLSGGSVTLSSDAGYVVAQPGSRIDVSGASANFDQLQASGTYASQPVWSDAGSITLSAAYGLFADATLAAHAGAPQGRGGTLAILPHQNNGATGATALVIRQSGELTPAGLGAGQSFATAIDTTTGLPIGKPTGVIQFSVDRLDGSGVANLVLGNATPLTAAIEVPPIAFAGDVKLALSESVTLNTGRVAALGMDQFATLLSTPATQSNGSTNPASVLQTLLAQPPQRPSGTTIEIDAPYVALIGPTLTAQSLAFAPVATLSDATLNVNASFIDLRNQFQLNNIGHANFVSAGDIRMSSSNANSLGTALSPGILYTPGNVSFRAADLYPATGSTFIVDAVGPIDPATGKPAPTTVTFASNGASGTPLSAGGTLLVDATDIVQGGTVRAPSGTIVFGVGDPSNAATQAQFAGQPLVATDSVTFANGSTTSVSNGGLVIPYGTTVDGVEWQFNPTTGATAPDLTAPPAKYIGVNGSRVALDKGAKIDLSGGGDLQAVEWVPGTGGTRDVLSQYNVSYANNPAGATVPVNPGATNVYAIVPGAQSPVAAYDPVFAHSVQPSVDGSTVSSTVSLGLGQAGLKDPVGKAVYLTGVPGLAAGYYTLLPGKYATLPGAYRVTLASAPGNVAPGASQVLPDGTVMTAGYFADALTGGRSATPTLFNVQSGPVWQQYSQYTLTGANAFFAAQAAKKGNVTPPSPVDGGQLVLAATKALTLGATLNTAAGSGGAPAEVDIASRDIQVVGNGGTALPGYLQIGSDALDSLNAGSLLIGGTRSATTNGVTITPIANSVIVSNDGNTALKGPEILLVTKTDASGVDPNAVNGLRIDAGASIVASGDYPAAKDQPIAIAGDGALLRVSNGAMAPLTRTGSTGSGTLTVGAGATLAGGQALTLDSSGNLKVDPSAVLSATAITADGSAITFTGANGAAAAALPGFVIDPAGLAQFGSAQQVTLRSYGAIGFVGDVNATFGNSVNLSAGTFTSDGGSVMLNAQRIAFSNETGAPNGTAASGSGTLTVNAKEIDFGSGAKTASGFGSASMTASGGIVGQGTGTFDFGALPVTLNAPVYLADTSSASTVKTTGALTLNGASGTALATTPVGGAWHFIGGTIADNGATIAAPAGNVSLEATSGNLTIGSGSTVSAAGVSKQFFDIVQYAPAGAITLTADVGTVDVQAGSTLDFSGAKGGGAAGSLTLSAPKQVVNLNGTIKGGAASGYAGGSLSLDTGGAADLDALAKTLASSGVNQAIAIHTRSGNLALSAGNTLTAHAVSLTADGGAGNALDTANGNVNVSGTIDASGKAGGAIALYGRSGVDVEGTLLARGSDSKQRGGRVDIGTSGVFDPSVADPYNATYGYENIDPSRAGLIRVGANALIDVSGGTAGGLSGGTVNFRAPLLSDGTVNVALPSSGFAAGKGIAGSRATTLEAYATWSTTDATTGAKHFDGIVDPAGWYDASGHLLAGTFTAQGTSSTPTTFTFTPDGSGGGTVKNNTTGATSTVTQAQLQSGSSTIGFGGLQSMFFAPVSGGSNTDHQTFYGYQDGNATTAAPGTLMGFVQHGLDALKNPFDGTGIANARIVPGIELDNPSPAINGGNIEVLTNWNLGAGTSATNQAFRFNGQAPIVTLRAENDVNVRASLSDGFFQIANPTGTGVMINVPASSTYAIQNGILMSPDNYYFFGYYLTKGLPSPAQRPFNFTSGDPAEIGQYYGLYSAYLSYLSGPTDAVQQHALGQYFGNVANLFAYYGNNLRSWATNPDVAGQPTASVPYPTGAAQNDAGAYLRYLAAYNNYLDSTIQFYNATGVKPHLDALKPPPAVLAPVLTTTSIVVTPPVTDNTPAPVAMAGNALPLASASLVGGASSSYRIVGGADLSSTDPLALKPAPGFVMLSSQSSVNGGNVTLDGHFEYNNATNPNINNPNGLVVIAPTLIRTGSGSIDVAAAGSVSLFDPSKPQDAGTTIIPGAIYTAGVPSTAAPVAPNNTTIVPGGGTTPANILVTESVNPEAAGDISIHAQGNVTGIENVVDANGSISGQAGTPVGQFWWQWMQVAAKPTWLGSGKFVPLDRTSIDFGAFDQGVMSIGGNISISAGGNVTDLGVSLPTTWYKDVSGTPVTVGGGNLTVRAGGDILSGDYFVAKGVGAITAGGRIGSDIVVQPWAPGLFQTSLAPLLATQDGIIDVAARQGADIGGIFNPSYLMIQSNTLLGNFGQYADAQAYSPGSAVNVVTTTGDVVLGSLSSNVLLRGPAPSMPGTDPATILPATLNVTAFSGGIDVASRGALFPSASGNLSLIADQSVNISDTGRDITTRSPVFGMIDSDPSTMPSAETPFAAVPSPVDPTAVAHASSALHADDTSLARIYSLNGDIVNGALQSSGGGAGFYDKLMQVVIDKPAMIQAGQDIVNLSFQGQNLRKSDVTRIVAGRDIYDTPLVHNATVVPALTLGGPGYFDIEAGRNIGPLTSQSEAYAALTSAYPKTGLLTGINATGNASNPNLPHDSANVNILFGVSPGVDTGTFISKYIDPAASIAGVPGAASDLIAFVQQYEAGSVVDTGLVKDQRAIEPLDAMQAWSKFKNLPTYVQQIFAEQVLFNVLTRVGEDYNNAASPYFQKYARGYEAINTLFPASFGYTANNLGGGGNGTNKAIDTGDLDIRNTTIQTQQGGSISILGPGGQALVGSASAPPQIADTSGNVIVGPGAMGILTLEKGNVNIFTDRSVLLAQSRIFTEQGGDMTIWSSNGDINAGKGAKSSADTPAPQYVCDPNHYCLVDARGQVTGAGIATLQSVPGIPLGTINLIAPRGTVDAGDAGIRAGNLNIAALRVVNADNIQVTGKASGIPLVQAVNTGALTAASAAASAATQVAQDMAKNNASGGTVRRWAISVQVEGFGDAGGDGSKKHRQQVGYDPSNSVSIIGFGKASATQRAALTEGERARLGKI